MRRRVADLPAAADAPPSPVPCFFELWRDLLLCWAAARRHLGPHQNKGRERPAPPNQIEGHRVRLTPSPLFTIGGPHELAYFRLFDDDLRNARAAHANQRRAAISVRPALPTFAVLAGLLWQSRHEPHSELPPPSTAVTATIATRLQHGAVVVNRGHVAGAEVAGEHGPVDGILCRPHHLLRVGGVQLARQAYVSRECDLRSAADVGTAQCGVVGVSRTRTCPTRSAFRRRTSPAQRRVSSVKASEELADTSPAT